MATSNEKWEVVGKTKKKPSSDNKKSKSKPFENGMPKAEFNNPLEESVTKFKVLGQKDKKIQQENSKISKSAHSDPSKSDSSKSEDESTNKYPETPIKHRVDPKKKASKPPQKSERELLTIAVNQLDVDDMKSLMTNVEQVFPDNPSFWLKDLASYMQLKLNIGAEKDPVFDKEQRDYPLCLVQKPVHDYLIKVLKNSQKSTLQMFLQHCVNTMMSEIARGHATFGLRIMVQCLVKVLPKVTTMSIKEYQDVLEARKTRHREALSLLWVLGQSLDNDFDQSLVVWFQYMIPYLGIKQLANYVVSYLENVLKGPLKKNLVIQPNEFLSILDIGLSTSSPLSYNQDLQNRVALLFPKFKSLAFGYQPQERLKDFFPSLLKRLNKAYPAHYLTEVQNCLCVCLVEDPSCFALWNKLYKKHIQESSILLKYLVETFDTTKFPKGKLQELIRSFSVDSEELKHKGRFIPGLQSCIQSCKALEEKKKKKSSFFSFKRLLKLLFFLQLVAVSVDIYKHRGYKGSKTSRLIKEYGIEEAVEKSLAQGKIWADQTNSWAADNYPEYYTKTIEVMGPPCKLAGEKLTKVWDWFLEVSKPARDYLNEKVPKILEKVEAELPVYIDAAKGHLSRFWGKVGPHIIQFFNLVRDFIKEYGPIVIAQIKEFILMIIQRIYELAPEFFDSASLWCKDVSEQIKEKGPQVLLLSQEYAITAMHMTHDIVTGIIDQIKKAHAERQKASEPAATTPQEQAEPSSTPAPETVHKPADTPSKPPPPKQATKAEL